VAEGRPGSLGGVPAPRVRIAPSPTGYFHVGTARAALYNWLYARQHGGTFILRIEDTDTARNRDEHTAGIQRAMQWLGLGWDEGPYFQSERGSLYADAIGKLIASGAVYACDCTTDQIAERNRAAHRQPGYDGHCRDRGADMNAATLLRFRTPDEGITTFAELVKGHNGQLSSPNASIEDFGVRKSNGSPLFLLANVVDDADMAISHVIRGDDHTTNTYKYVLLWEALGYGPPPVFAHLPLLLNEQRRKLSKRRDKVAVEDYRDEGYLSEAVVNYLVLLGWSPGDDREMLTRSQMLDEFRLEDVKSSGAVFDVRKMQSFNSEYLRALSPGEFVERSSAWLRDRWEPLAPLVQERARTLGDVFAMTDFLFREPPVIDQTEWDRALAKQPAFATILDAAIERYGEVDWGADAIKEATVAAGESVGVPQLGKAQAPIRLAVTGRAVGPPLFESLVLLGRERTLGRLVAGRGRVGEAPDAG
jgi:glutamyl-tRNA synthetase